MSDAETTMSEKVWCDKCQKLFRPETNTAPFNCVCGAEYTEESQIKVDNSTPTPSYDDICLTRYVYLIKNSLGQVKIGVSENPERRKKSLQTGSPHKLTIVATRKSSHATQLEEALHNRWEEYHMRGEWFDIPKDELNALVQRFKNE